MSDESKSLGLEGLVRITKDAVETVSDAAKSVATAVVGGYKTGLKPAKKTKYGWKKKPKGRKSNLGVPIKNPPKKP